MKKTLLLPLLMALCWMGCGHKSGSSSEPAQPTPAQPAANLESMVGQPGGEAPPPPPAPAAAEAQPPPTPGTENATPDSPSGPDADDSAIARYNRALSQYIYQRDDLPMTLEELKSRTGLPPLPKPPPGRRLVYKPNPNAPPSSAIRLE